VVVTDRYQRLTGASTKVVASREIDLTIGHRVLTLQNQRVTGCGGSEDIYRPTFVSDLYGDALKSGTLISLRTTRATSLRGVAAWIVTRVIKPKAGHLLLVSRFTIAQRTHLLLREEWWQGKRHSQSTPWADVTATYSRYGSPVSVVFPPESSVPKGCRR
jgi:hypothetical protein